MHQVKDFRKKLTMETTSYNQTVRVVYPVWLPHTSLLGCHGDHDRILSIPSDWAKAGEFGLNWAILGFHIQSPLISQNELTK